MNIIKGKQKKASKVVIYGAEGVGKSTLSSKCPDPLFIDVEGSTKDLDVARTEQPTTATILKEQINYVIEHPTICKTLVIDTADWMEKLVTEDLLTRNKWKGIEDLGYGKGYVYLAEEFAKVLKLLDKVIDKNIHVVLTAHAMMRKQELPNEQGAFDRWELKLSKKCAPLLKEWADELFFCNYDTILVAGDGNTKKAKGQRRVIYTEHHACWDAKTRKGIADKSPMEFEAIAEVFPDDLIPAHDDVLATNLDQLMEEVKEEPKPKKKAKKTADDLIAEASKMDIPVTVIGMYDGIDSRLVEKMQPKKISPANVTNLLIQLGYQSVSDLRNNDNEATEWLLSVWEQIEAKLNELPFEI